MKSQIVIDQIRDILVNKTKKYSKRQRTWIKNRFQAKGLNIVKFDTTGIFKLIRPSTIY